MTTATIETPAKEQEDLSRDERLDLDRRVRLDRELETGEILVTDPDLCM